MSSELAANLATCEPRTKIRLTGVLSGEEEQWHVNNNMQIAAGGVSKRNSVILQKGDGSPVWVAAIMDKTDDGWEFDELTLFEGDLPDDMGAEEHGESLDPEGIDFAGSV
jgi:hypothetical protein